MTDTSLHLLHMMPDARLLAAWVARHHARHEREPADLGDALHGLLLAAFGEAAPQPFRYLGVQHGLLAYTSLDLDAVRSKVALADPLASRTLGLGETEAHDGFQLRPFPTRWQAGHVLGFEVRVRPTVRGAKGERDAFLHAVDRALGAPVQRQDVYVRWLRDHLSPQGGENRQAWQSAVSLMDDVHLTSYQRLRIVRRTQCAEGVARHGQVIDGPDAVLKGHLRVADPPAFARLLARGVGRHRAFGFGMLLLSRAA